MLWQDDVNEYYIISRHAGAVNTISPIVSTSKRGGGPQRAQGGGPPLEGPGPVRRTALSLRRLWKKTSAKSGHILVRIYAVCLRGARKRRR